MKKISKIINDIPNPESVVLKIEKTVVKPPKSPKPPKPPKERKKPVPLYNEEGVRINKDGSISKAGKGVEALRKWRENQKKLKEQKTVAPPVESEDEESDPEYEIEDIEIKKPDPIVVEKPVEVVKEVIKEVEKPIEIIKPDLLVLKENEELKAKNKKLEESFRFNDHLSRISNMARVTSLKF